MSATSLSNLDVDKLFEQHSVAEIDIIQKKVQAVVEKKREELRLMVGESYRDLLRAADTIKDMQKASEVLITQIDSIMANCRSLNEQQLIGFQTSDSADELLKQRQTNKLLNTYFNTMIQIKLLVVLPEIIWSQIDQDRFYHAAELFIFSSHISAGLQLDSNKSTMQHFPVAKKQWELLKSFHSTIKQKILRTLEQEIIHGEVAVDCILALLLLEKSSINSVIRTFLQLRCNAYSMCLREDIGADGSEWRPAKDRILASLNVLYGTMVLLEKCLLENGLLQEKFNEYALTAPTIAWLDDKDDLHTHMLPEIITNFRPKLELQNFESSQISQAIEQFLSDTKSAAATHLTSCFALVKTIKAVQEVKERASEIKKLANISAAREKFQLHVSLEFYETEYLPRLNQRVQDIVDKNWSDLMQGIVKRMCELRPTGGDAGAHNFWSNDSEDLPLSLAMALSDDDKSKKLLMKIKGYSSDILNLCRELDEQLALIVKEINVLVTDPATRSEDKAGLIDFLRKTSQLQLHSLLSEIQNVKSTSPDNNVALLFLARTCLAFLELTPHLRSCFSLTAAWRHQLGHVGHSLSQKGAEQWQQVCQAYKQEILSLWTQIVDNILREQNCKQLMPPSMTATVILDNFTCWETVSLDQKDEEGNVVNSNFRIPTQPTIALQSCLFELVAALNSTIPETLPSKVIQIFNQRLLEELLTFYEGAAESVLNTPTVSSLSLQFYFDLRFLQAVFITSPEQRSLSQRLVELQSRFKQNIDPFDFELFSDNLNGNVANSAVRLTNQIGVLLQTKSLPSLSATSASSAQDRDPNVLRLSASGSTSLWFPLLPIVTTEKSRDKSLITSEKPSNLMSKSTSAVSARKTGNEHRSKPGSTSFFGAMSQDWFR